MERTIRDSANGKINGYIHGCKAIGQSKYYAVCVHLIHLHTEGKDMTGYADCENAIKKGNCQAVAMRNEEVAAFKAIYFKERVREEGLVSQPVKTHDNVTKSPVIEFQDANYAEAINSALEKLNEEASEVPTVENIEGESLLEMAKRLQKEKT